MTPEIDPLAVNCMNNTRWLSASGNPFAEPLVTNHAPPYESFTVKS